MTCALIASQQNGENYQFKDNVIFHIIDQFEVSTWSLEFTPIHFLQGSVQVVSRDNAQITRDNAQITRDNAQITRDNAQITREKLIFFYMWVFLRNTLWRH